ncbi:hypothetical protein ACWCQZ_46660 [Streptomyces sp. NPDC002285]
MSTFEVEGVFESHADVYQTPVTGIDLNHNDIVEGVFESHADVYQTPVTGIDLNHNDIVEIA